MEKEQEEFEEFEDEVDLNETCPIYKLTICGYDKNNVVVLDHVVGEFQYADFATDALDVLVEHSSALRDQFKISDEVEKIEISVITFVNEEELETICSKTI